MEEEGGAVARGWCERVVFDYTRVTRLTGNGVLTFDRREVRRG